MRRLFFGLSAFLLLAAAPALAQPAPPERVGRVSLVVGTLAYHMAGERAWSAAALNYPAASGATFWAAPGARAQMQLGPNTLGLDGDSTLDLTTLDAATTRLGLWSGRLVLHVRAIDAGKSIEVDIPRGAVRLLSPGEYEIAAGSGNEPAQVAVFSGRAHFAGDGADIGVAVGKMAVLQGENPLNVRFAPAHGDAFLAWCRAHDYHQNRLAAPYYLSPEIAGYAALDQYGRWTANPEYGQVWYPNDVPADWAPYRFGHWVWVAPWGWTWIDEAPWGFAPFHYGRWAYIGGRWGWVPGRFERSPVYAPALVAFIGGTGVGWFPLAPGEAYWPSYTRNLAYIRRLNAGAVKDVDRLKPGPRGAPPREAAARKFSNRRFATVVPRPVFERGGRVDKARLKVEKAKLEQAPVRLVPPKIAPVVVHPVVRPPVPVRPGVAKTAPPSAAPRKPKKNEAVAPPHAPAPSGPANAAVIPPGKQPPAETPAQKKAREEALRRQQEKARTGQQQQQQEQARKQALEQQQRAAQRRAAQQQEQTRKQALEQQQRAAQQQEQARKQALEQQQRAAQQRAAEQQRAAQQRAAEQQRAAQQRAAQQQQQAQQRAAQQRAIEQQRAQQHPQQHPPGKAPPACGHPGEPPCPH